MAFMIVGNGQPLFELVTGQSSSRSEHDGPNSHQFAMHAALDSVDEQLWSSQVMNLKQVDTFQGQIISAYVTASGIVLMLMHDNRVSDFLYTYHFVSIRIISNLNAITKYL